MGKTPDEAVKEFEGKGYGELKMAVGEGVVSVLKPLQEEVARLEKDKGYIDSIIKENAEKAQYFANKTLRKVQRKVWFPGQDPVTAGGVSYDHRRSDHSFSNAGGNSPVRTVLPMKTHGLLEILL